MPNEQIPITPALVTWARERAGLTLEEAAQTFKRIEEWERGDSFPTYAQLEQMSERLKLPVAVFFFPTPPDPELFELFKTVTSHPERRCLKELERWGVIPNASYFNDLLADEFGLRHKYFDRASAQLADASLVFFDPDNGIEVPSVKKGRRNSSKYVYYDEISQFFGRGQSILVYQYFPFEKRVPFMKRIACELGCRLKGGRVRVFRTPHAAFFLAAQPSQRELLTRPSGPLERLGISDA